MKVHTVHLVSFSPTGSTQKILRTLAQQIPFPIREHSLTDKAIREQLLRFGEDDLVLLGMPVYYGRIPDLFHENLQIQGQNTPVVCIVVYGNREYDDALLELKTKSEQAGFMPLAAGAFIAEHSLNPAIANQRPDAADLEKIRDFGKMIAEKVTVFDAKKYNPFPVKGNFPYREYGGIPFIPGVDHEKCTQCGLCARVCPVQGINYTDFSFNTQKKCLFCYACVKNCPTGARGLTEPEKVAFAVSMKKIAQMAAQRREPEFFI